MQEVEQTTSEVGSAISDIIRAVIDTIGLVIEQINQELTSYIKVTGFVVSYSITELLDKIFTFYSYEWPIVEASIDSINNWLNTLALQEAAKINTLLSNFSILTDTILKNFEKQIAQIDDAVNPAYQERMFTIYGQIADFSKAINAPPSYLEEAIQNARSFAISISCLEGLSYYQFLADWDNGVSNLLNRIANSVSLYRANPQQIKVDIENNLIRPIFEIEIAKRRKQQQLLASLNNRIGSLEVTANALASQINEAIDSVSSLYDLVIAPKLEQIQDRFNAWENDIYTPDITTTRHSFTNMFLDIAKAFAEIGSILGILDYGGDLLLRIDKLSSVIKTEQEDKIADVSTRRFRELIPNWLVTVKERTG
jgi:hypothetical protein